MDCGELHFIVFINHTHHVEGFRKVALRATLEELLAERSTVGDVLSNKLMHRDVHHVVLDGEVGARGIDSKSGVVIDEDDLGAEETLDFSDNGFIRLVSLESFIFGHVVTAILEHLS